MKILHRISKKCKDSIPTMKAPSPIEIDEYPAEPVPMQMEME
jgi:hypothetical protein